jgi:hypothetical protein
LRIRKGGTLLERKRLIKSNKLFKRKKIEKTARPKKK